MYIFLYIDMYSTFFCGLKLWYVILFDCNYLVCFPSAIEISNIMDVSIIHVKYITLVAIDRTNILQCGAVIRRSFFQKYSQKTEFREDTP